MNARNHCLSIASHLKNQRLASRRETLAWIALWVSLFALAGYLYRWTSLSFSHDSLYVNALTGTEILSTTLSNGRFLLPLYYCIRGGLAAPLLVGILGTAFLILAIFFIVRLLDIQSRAIIAILCGLLTVNACITLLNATYIKDYDCDMLALLFSVLGVYSCFKFRHGSWGAALFFAASLGLYQSFIQVAIVLVLAFLLKQALEGKGAIRLLKSAVRVGVSLVAAACLYILLLQGAKAFTGLEGYETYNSVSSLGSGLTLSSFFASLGEAYIRPLLYLLRPETYAMRLSGALNVFIFIIVLIAFIAACLQRRLKASSLIISVICLGAMPLASDCIYPFSNGVQHGLMVYSFNLWYVVAAMLIDLQGPSRCTQYSEKQSQNHKKLIRNSLPHLKQNTFLQGALVVCCCIILYSNIVYSNQVALKKDIEFNSTLSVMTRVVNSMDSVTGYEPGTTPVAFIGRLDQNPLLSSTRVGFPSGEPNISMPYGTGLYSQIGVTGYFSYNYYFRNILGYPLLITDASLYKTDPQISDKIDRLPAFPHNGYCELMDGILFVKLSEDQEP